MYGPVVKIVGQLVTMTEKAVLYQLARGRVWFPLSTVVEVKPTYLVATKWIAVQKKLLKSIDQFVPNEPKEDFVAQQQPALTPETPRLLPMTPTAERTVTREEAVSWLLPRCQRPFTDTKKVREFAAQLVRQKGRMTPSAITIGVWEGRVYIVDGQHRIRAFLDHTSLAFIQVLVIVKVYADGPEGEKQLSDDFEKLQKTLVRQSPDNALKAQMLAGNEALQYLVERCPFMIFDRTRRAVNVNHGTGVSVSAALRAWAGAGATTPNTAARPPALTMEEILPLSEFLLKAHRAWGWDADNKILWSALNLTLCMWFYRNTVLKEWRVSSNTLQIEPALFEACLAFVGGVDRYRTWLSGRVLNDASRPLAFGRLRAIFATRIRQVTGKPPRMPAPEWGKVHGVRDQLLLQELSAGKSLEDAPAETPERIDHV